MMSLYRTYPVHHKHKDGRRKFQHVASVGFWKMCICLYIMLVLVHHGIDAYEEEKTCTTPLLSKLNVNIEQVVKQIEELGLMSDTAEPAVTRLLYSHQDVSARKFIKDLMQKAGLKVREDAMGNIYGRLEGTNPSLPPVVSGSHTDAIPSSGKYDGVVGVIGAIEALRALKKSGCQFEHPLEAMMFTSEEPTRFGLSCIGSRAMCGRLDVDYLLSLRDENGTTFLDAANSASYSKGKTVQKILEETKIEKGQIKAFLELHIEQGPLLEEEKLDIGIVTAIAAPAALSIDFEGNGGHAGALLMPYRKDAGLAAAELALSVESIAFGTKVIDTVATTGVMQIHPGAINSVPRESHVEIDVRDIDKDRRNAVLDQIKAAAKTISDRRKVQMQLRIINQDPPASCASEVINAVSNSVGQLQLTSKRMVSRAYHDALFMAQIAPTGMLFIPCRGGVSHRPDEFASPKDIKNGIQTLALAMAELAVAKCKESDKEL